MNYHTRILSDSINRLTISGGEIVIHHPCKLIASHFASYGLRFLKMGSYMTVPCGDFVLEKGFNKEEVNGFAPNAMLVKFGIL